jgi:hypothetical protein
VEPGHDDGGGGGAIFVIYIEWVRQSRRVGQVIVALRAPAGHCAACRPAARLCWPPSSA